MPQLVDERIRHATVAVNGVQLKVVEAGPVDGPLVVLLHGFPEFWYGWRHQIGPLVDAGFRVLVPDQRGYAASDKPRELSAYSLDALADDVVGLIESTGRPWASVVGHDWGGLVAWWTALRRPARVERLVALNAPHPLVMRKFLRSSPLQMLKSWYTYYFQIPTLPEAVFRAGHWKRLAGALRRTSRPGTFTDADLDFYRKAWEPPGTITAMLNWYRAAAKHPPLPPADPRVRMPTLVIWGKKDAYLRHTLGPASLAMCEDGRLERIDWATHWVQHEAAEPVNRLLIDFLRPPEPEAAA